MRKLGYLLLALTTLIAIPSLAINYGGGTYGACQYGSCSITISSSGSVNLDVAPSGSGKCTTQSDTVSVFTDDSSGYALTAADSGTNTALVNGGASISATSGTQASPVALTVSKWGYRVDGIGSFGSGPTSAASNQDLGSTTFAGIPASNATADTLASTSVAADPAVNTTVWYGLCVNTSIANGSYSTQVTYSAVAN